MKLWELGVLISTMKSATNGEDGEDFDYDAEPDEADAAWRG